MRPAAAEYQQQVATQLDLDLSVAEGTRQSFGHRRPLGPAAAREVRSRRNAAASRYPDGWCPRFAVARARTLAW
ncbi:hypothetical protein AB0B97_00595 [Micromonospora sp. NPDC049004]